MAAGKSLLSRYEYVQLHMGTQFRMLYAPDGAKAGEAADLAFARITEILTKHERLPHGERINRLCRLLRRPSGQVSDDLFGRTLCFFQRTVRSEPEALCGYHRRSRHQAVALRLKDPELPDEARLGRFGC
ncbi:MAG: hypothetical protein IPL01_24625 [Acidobacteria bacterium]|nr:hypothetical protein [Acidobacteriota bacterium]